MTAVQDMLALSGLTDAKLERLAETLLTSAAQAQALSFTQLEAAKRIRQELERRKEGWPLLTLPIRNAKEEKTFTAAELAEQAAAEEKHEQWIIEKHCPEGN